MQFPLLNGIRSNLLTASVLAVIAASCGCGRAASAADVTDAPRFAYVANVSANTVSEYMINPATGQLGAKGAVAAGQRPRGIATDPLGRYVYVVNYKESTFFEYTITNDGVLTPMQNSPINVGEGPLAVIVDRSGKFVYILNHSGNTISQFGISGNGALNALNPARVRAGSGPSLSEIRVPHFLQ